MNKPILFCTQMLQAVLAGRKTMTRRVVKPQPHYHDKVSSFGSSIAFITDKTLNHTVHCPHGQVGDILWVREAWQVGFIYRADNFPSTYIKWKPSIHMPKETCRLFLRITNVRVERLQEITEQDAINEGVESWIEERIKSKPIHYKVYHQETPNDPSFYSSSAVGSFETLWQSINGEQSWNDNPWIWVIEFERVNSLEG